MSRNLKRKRKDHMLNRNIACIGPIALILISGLLLMTDKLYADTSNSTTVMQNEELYPSSLEFKEYLGSNINSGVITLSSDEPVQLNYVIKYYGRGDISKLDLAWNQLPGITVSSVNNQDGTGSITLTADQAITPGYMGISFMVRGAATTYSQRITLNVISAPVIPDSNNQTETDQPTPSEPAEPVKPVDRQVPLKPSLESKPPVTSAKHAVTTSASKLTTALPENILPKHSDMQVSNFKPSTKLRHKLLPKTSRRERRSIWKILGMVLSLGSLTYMIINLVYRRP